jgi:prevent-host-death family protein
MEVSVSDAKALLTDLVRRAEAGEEVILTRHGHATARIVPIKAAPDRPSRGALLDAGRGSARGTPPPRPSAARSEDFLCRSDVMRAI